MPDYYLFYQTMDPYFDGEEVERNSNLDRAMQVVSGYLKKGQVVAAGFTDVQLLDRLVLYRTLSSIASNLDGGLGSYSLFATGVLGWPECTAICVNKSFVVEKRGRVMRVNQETGDPLWTCVSEQEVPIDDLKSSVNYFETRSRGLAYVCGKFGDQKMIVGFTHKISAEGRENTYQLLTSIMQLIWDKYPDYSGYPTIFGGDFTFAPSPMDKPYYAIYASTPSGVSTTDSSTWDPVPTSDGRGFDFWVANEEISNDNASLYAVTNGFRLSYHSGISLRLPMEVSFGD